MKIGVFSPYLDSLTGGEKYILSCASCLSKHHEVFLFWDPQKEQEIKKQASDKFGIELGKVMFTQNIFNSNTSFLQRLLQTKQYDRILFLSDGSIPLTLCRLILHFQFPVEWVNGRSLKTKIKLLQVESVICNSNYTKSYIDKTFGVASTVLYPPCDIGESSPKKTNTILHVGRFGLSREGANYKKQDVMIEVFKQMVDSGLKLWRFVLIISVLDSQKEKLQELKELAKGYPIEFITNATKTVVSSYYFQSKLYWHASGFGEDLKKYPEKAEHFGIATVEAMAGGCVPVVINAGGQPEIVEHKKNGYLWNSKEELILYTDQLIKNENERKKLSINATLRAKKFSSDSFCENLENIFNTHE